MLRHDRLLSRVTAAASFVRSFFRTQRTPLISLALLLIGSVLAALFVQSLPGQDSLYVGNTAGALTSLIEVDDRRVLVGAGPTRSHSADLVGRSTRPWSRDIDLLLIPGWDDTHAVGALGLLERRTVTGIGVIGTPGDEPIWTLLERQAQRDDVPIRFLSSPHQLELNAGVTLRIADLDRQHPGAWMRLDYHGMRIDLVDAGGAGNAIPPASAFEQRNDHVLINMREQVVPEFAEPQLLVRPMPFSDDEFNETETPFVQELPRNEQVRIELTRGELRLPLETVEH